MPSASNIATTNTKLVKQSSVNSMNSCGPSGSSAGGGGGGGGKGSKKLTDNSTTKSNNSSNNETSSKSAKEVTNNVVVAATTIASVTTSGSNNNGKNWETNSTTGSAAAANKDVGNDALNPMKLTFTTIEHKIRNLEKRKTKLEGYRALDATGKELSTEQRAAVNKYDAVCATLEFARDLVKQMQQFAKDAEKEQKKQARKDLIAKAQAETVKIREVLIIQNILSCFTDEAVRNDFLAGEHGAAKMEQSELDIIEKFCMDVQTRRPETAEDVPFATSAQKAAEIFSMTIDARPKQYGETTYENVNRVFHRIQECDYLDKIYLTDVAETEMKEEINDTDNVMEDGGDGGMEVIGQEQEDSAAASTALEEDMENLNMAENVTAGNEVSENVMVQQQQVQSQQPMQQQLHNEHMEMQQQQQPHQQQQQSQQQVLSNMPAAPLIQTPMAPPASAVPAFQTTAPGAHSGATTPVHVAMYAAIPAPTPQQMQQIPPGGAMMANVPQPTGPGQLVSGATTAQLAPQQAPTGGGGVNQQTQQRQMLGSPANTGVSVPGMAPMQQPPPPPPGLYNPTPVHAVEQGFFNTHPQQQQQQHVAQQQQQAAQQHQQYLQQMRPLAEVIGGGNFYFLQDSELDSPEQCQAGGPQATLIFEQQGQTQAPQQPPQQQTAQQQAQMMAPQAQQQQQVNMQTLSHQQKPSPNLLAEQNAQILTNGSVAPTSQVPVNANMPPQQQQQVHQNVAQAPIQTQTFTNQSFPQIAPASQAANVLANNSPSPLFHQQQQQQQQIQQQQTAQQSQKGNMQQNPPQQQQQMLMSTSVDAAQQAPALMLMNRLGAGATGNPQNSLIQHQMPQSLPQQQQQQTGLLPQQVASSNAQNLMGGAGVGVGGGGGVMQQHQLPNDNQNDLSSTTAPKNAGGFPFDNPVVAGLNYDQQMQNQLNNAANVLKKSLGVRDDETKATTVVVPLNKTDLINDWADAGLKNTGVVAATNANNAVTNTGDFKSSNAGPETNKWNTAEVNANSPITVQTQQQRKNEWTSSSAAGSSNANSSEGYDNRNDASNHWHAQDSQGYGRNSANRNQGTGGGGQGNAGGGYQRRNDDRRDDRRPGGGNPGGGGGYRGRSNYGSGGPQQNGGNTRGGGQSGGGSGGIYFRNNENNNSGGYYQNGSGGGGGGGNVYAANKDGGSRYEPTGPGNYRGPRTSGNSSSNPRSNGPPPRHMGGGGGGGGRTQGGQSNSSNSNSNSYMNSRQSSNRMPLGLENKN
ncbi:cell cycle associated protein caprin family member [Haematobia irritans]|uniref:cell cycle associated protein caprin family member n=1 Tax=Haematobia irritans TaxID=7368 RepID=UPI003F5094FF